MVLIESIAIPLGTSMPDFKLKDPSEKEFEGAKLFGEKGFLIGFLCNHCPYAIAVWPRFVRLAQYAKTLGINTVAINSNINPDFPEDSPERMIDKIKEWNINFPYLVDESQDVARAYDAACTPDLFLFDDSLKCAYRGQLDDSRPKNDLPVTGKDLRVALEALLAGKEISENQIPSIGCNIKWKP